MSNALGGRLRQARIAQGLSLAELADKIGMSGSAISNWERGVTAPNQEKVTRLEGVLGKFLPSDDDDAEQSATPPSNAFGAWLSKARSKQEMSVPELARASGLSAVAIYNIESGRSLNPQSETRKRLEGALKVETPIEVQKEIAEEQDIKGVGVLTDFDPHDQESLPNAPGVYVFYDISQRPIYVGKAENIGRRVREHSDKFWFKSPIVFNASYVEIANSELRHSVEQVLIKFLKSNAVINKQSVER